MSLAAVDGALLVAYGARLEIHRWTGSRLETMAFHDAAVLVTSVSVIKRFVAVGDVHMGVSFLQVANDNRHFNDLSKARLSAGCCCRIVGRESRPSPMPPTLLGYVAC